MALRLRRGTDAERQTITPLEGELIYTTDTEKLYVGDGTTVGGNPIDSDTITDQLSDLSDVSLAGLQDGQTIAYDVNNNRFEPADLASSINDLTDVDTTGVALNNVLKWNGAAFVPAVEGARHTRCCRCNRCFRFEFSFKFKWISRITCISRYSFNE